MSWRTTPHTMIVSLVMTLLVGGCVAPAATAVPPTATLTPTRAPSAAPTAIEQVATPRPLPATEQDCVQQGGSWGPQGKLGSDMCNLPALDAGKPCTDVSQCEGTCFAGTDPTATSGTCSPYTLNFGCYAIVQGGVPMTICVD